MREGVVAEEKVELEREEGLKVKVRLRICDTGGKEGTGGKGGNTGRPGS